VVKVGRVHLRARGCHHLLHTVRHRSCVMVTAAHGRGLGSENKERKATNSCLSILELLHQSLHHWLPTYPTHNLYSHKP
jgi:hypothetical protein